MLRIFLISLLLFSALPAMGEGSALSVGTEDASLEAIKSILEDGRPDEAMKQLDRLLKRDSDNPEARFLKGLILVNQNKLEDSIAVFEALTKDYPDLPEPYNNLAVSYSALGRFDDARTALLAAITTHPSYATAHENLGNIYAMMAAEAYDQALVLDEENYAARDKLALMNELFSIVPTGETLPPGATGKEEEAPSKSERSSPTPAAPPEEKAPTKFQKASPAPAAPPEEKAPAKFQKTSPAPAASPEEDPELSIPMTAEASPEEDPELSIPMEAEALPEEDPELSAPVMAEVPSETIQELNPAADLDRDLLSITESWARAWSNKDLDAYLDFYHTKFKPSKGLSRSAWEKQRRRRISKPRFIKVKISYPAVKSLGNERARITFVQSYRSNTYSDETRKSLDMERSEDGWKILREVALK